MTALPAVLAASAAAAAQRAELAHLDAFRLAGATAPARAVRPERLGLARDDAFARLAARGVLKETAGGGCYLDEAAVIAHRDRPAAAGGARLLLVLLLVAMLVGLGLLMRSRKQARGERVSVFAGEKVVTVPPGALALAR